MQLRDTRILDLTQLVPGPFATQLLADLGADVVKVEPPDGGDGMRGIGSPAWDAPDADTDRFLMLNRNKRSVVIDLKTDAGREAFLDLAASADAIVEQFRPGVVERLGVDYESVREVNDRIVYCSLSGFGQTGPYSDRPGHDVNYMGVGGLLDRLRDADGNVVLPGFPIADLTGGMFAALSILAALYRSDTGRGEYVDLSMTDAVVSLLGGVAGGADTTVIDGAYPCYNVYETADGELLTLAAIEPPFWKSFCAAIDRHDLVGNHLADGDQRESTFRAVEAELGSRSYDDLERLFEDHDVPYGPVNSEAEVLADEHLAGRSVLDDVVHPEAGELPGIGFPGEFETGLDRTRRPSPRLGEHTREVLAERYPPERIDRLVDEGAVETAGK